LILAMSSSTIIILKVLAEHIGARLRERDFASFLRMIWSVAGHAKRWRGQNGRQKSNTSPNLRVGLPQFSRVGSV
jgi:hypothetical protein